MPNEIEVVFTFHFYTDVQGIDPEFVDVEGLAREKAFREMKYLIDNGGITDSDFEIKSNL